MFKDYYRILDVSPNASQVEIRDAYRKMSIKWHPDKNPGKDVTSNMQDINEAYAILKDIQKRLRYDKEYERFCNIIRNNQKSEDRKTTEKKDNSQSDWMYQYDVQDEKLKEDINKAHQYAKQLVEDFLKNMKENSFIALKGAATNVAYYSIGWILSGIIIAIILMLLRFKS